MFVQVNFRACSRQIPQAQHQELLLEELITKLHQDTSAPWTRLIMTESHQGMACTVKEDRI